MWEVEKDKGESESGGKGQSLEQVEELEVESGDTLKCW